ncbi:ABC transporter permease subunit [Tropicimonas sp. IMCC34011]|uniref:ABC transporter permease subunit n=1 Tax=Tropicimonas sp. IMCC34011 TaxID=2248759 RepID=UPI000E268662|nr:ABC transporter permease subunit [Tropicimonas sp. IMCC34011]
MTAAVAPRGRTAKRKTKLGAPLLLLPIFAFLAVFFIYPVFSILAVSVTDRDGVLSWTNYIELFRGYNIQVMLTTLKISGWTTLFTILLSYPVAYLLATARKGSTNALMLIVLLPLWTSVLVRAFAWIVLFGRNGVINSGLVSIGLVEVPVEMLFTVFSVVVAMTHALMPIAVLSMYSTMQNIDRKLELAAATLGAEPGNAFWRIYFPISFPGVASAALVTFIVSIGIFVHPTLLGSPSERMIALEIIEQIDVLYNWGMAAAISVMVLILSIIFIMIFDKFLGIATITGAQGSGGPSGSAMRAATAGLGTMTVWLSRITGALMPKRKLTDGQSRRFALNVVAGLVLTFMAAPLFFLIPVSFTESAFVEWPPRGFSLQWYEEYFTDPVWREATIRSIVVGLATAILSMLIGVPAAFGINRARFKGKGLVLPYILMPLVVPNIIIALALFYFFAEMQLIGTYIGLVAGHTVIAVPYVVLTLIAVLQNYDHRLDQAAWTLGASTLTAFRRITLPLIKVGFVTSFLFAFMRSFDEIAIALFVSSGLQSTLPKKLWSEAHIAVSPTLAAVSTILIAVVALVVVASELLNRRSAGQKRT